MKNFKLSKIRKIIMMQKQTNKQGKQYLKKNIKTKEVKALELFYWISNVSVIFISIWSQNS